MITIAHTIFLFSTLFYGLSLLTAQLHQQAVRIVSCLFFLGLATNLFSISIRYYYSWPMLPMYNGPFFSPFFIGICFIFSNWSFRSFFNLEVYKESKAIIALVFLLACVALLFPKDFYLPFLKSKTVFSHLFFLFEVFGRSCFYLAAVKALLVLLGKLPKTQSNHRVINNWIILGFALTTLSIFSGELWSYLGWGTPVVWDDPKIVLTMAIWFFYGAYLHLHLIRYWNAKRKHTVAVFGAILLFALTCVSEASRLYWPI